MRKNCDEKKKYKSRNDADQYEERILRERFLRIHLA